MLNALSMFDCYMSESEIAAKELLDLVWKPACPVIILQRRVQHGF